jgi:cyclic pyranopterin phosphate synthase
LRLTSDGKLKPCLFNDVGFDIRKLGNETAVKMAVNAKPEQGLNNLKDSFYNIGG